MSLFPYSVVDYDKREKNEKKQAYIELGAIRKEW